MKDLFLLCLKGGLAMGVAVFLLLLLSNPIAHAFYCSWVSFITFTVLSFVMFSLTKDSY